MHVGPDRFRTVPCPTYPSIRLAVGPHRKLSGILDGFQPDALHLATEGPLGLAGRRYCRSHGLRFTSSYHTKFPHYVRMRAPIPISWTYRLLRWFHSAAERGAVPRCGGCVRFPQSHRFFRHSDAGSDGSRRSRCRVPRARSPGCGAGWGNRNFERRHRNRNHPGLEPGFEEMPELRPRMLLAGLHQSIPDLSCSEQKPQLENPNFF